MNLVNIFEDAGNDVVFVIDGERAYEHVMDKFGHIIEWSGDYMVAPRKVFNQIEEIVYSAGGEVEEVTGFEHPLEESTDMCKVCGQTPCNCTHISEATGLTFMGSPCTKDCSGHKAGYEWSEKRGGQTANSHSQSFNNGAAINANQHKPKTPPKAQQPKDAADRLRDKQAELVGPDKAKTLGLAEGKFNELSVMLADYHNMNISDVKFYGMYGKTRQQVAKEYANYLEEAISRRGFLKGAGAAAAAGAAGKASAIAGAFPTPSHQAAMYKAAADSNRAMAAQEVERQRQANAARASKLAADTKDVERLNRVNYHGNDAPKPTNAEWDGDSDFLYLDGTQYAKASRMPISGDVPSDLTLVSTREGRQVYLWTRRSLKGVQGHYFYPAEKPKTIDEGMGDEFGQKELKHTLARARAKFPRAASDTEALIMYVQDQEQQDVKKLDQVNDREDKEIDRLDQEENNIEQRLQSIERKLAGVMETRMYYNVVSTPDKDLRADFGLRKDKNGWYLKESATPKVKFQAYKAFGSPKLKEYDLSAVRGGSTGVISGADNPVSPIGSVPRGQQKARR